MWCRLAIAVQPGCRRPGSRPRSSWARRPATELSSAQTVRHPHDRHRPCSATGCLLRRRGHGAASCCRVSTGSRAGARARRGLPTPRGCRRRPHPGIHRWDLSCRWLRTPRGLSPALPESPRSPVPSITVVEAIDGARRVGSQVHRVWCRVVRSEGAAPAEDMWLESVPVGYSGAPSGTVALGGSERRDCCAGRSWRFPEGDRRRLRAHARSCRAHRQPCRGVCASPVRSPLASKPLARGCG